VPTVATFCEGLQRANGCNESHRDVVHYILDLGLLEIRMLQYTPSHIVSAALLLSNELLKHSPVWPHTMVQHTRYNESALRDCKEQLKLLASRSKRNPLFASVYKRCRRLQGPITGCSQEVFDRAAAFCCK